MSGFKTICSRLIIGAGAAFVGISLSAGEAKAVLTYNVFESGSNVVVQASGSLSLSGFQAPSLYFPGPLIVGPPAIVATGPDPGKILGFYSITGPQSYGMIPGTFSTISTGIYTALYGANNLFQIDPSYVSGSAVVSSATFANQTLTSLGFTTPGLIGTWTLVSGGDKINLFVGAPSAPVPGPLPLLGAGAAFGWTRRLRRRMASCLPQAPVF